MKIRYNHKVIVAIIFLLSLVIFGYLVFSGMRNDIWGHAKVVHDSIEGLRRPPERFLYFLTIYIFAFLRHDLISLYMSSIFVLSLAVVAKFIITERLFVGYIQGKDAPAADPRNKYITVFSISLLFVFCLPVFYAYRGTLYVAQMPPNVWHNSTVIFLMPFAILLFWFTYKQLVEPKNGRIPIRVFH